MYQERLVDGNRCKKVKTLEHNFGLHLMAQSLQRTLDSKFLQEPISTLPSQTAKSPGVIGRFFGWGINLATAPASWVASSAVEGASTRFTEILQQNESELVSRVQGAVNQALLRQAPPAFVAAKATLSQFLQTPHSANLAELRQALGQIQIEQHPEIYQQLSEDGRQRITELNLVLDALFATQENSLVVQGASDLYDPLDISSIKEHLQDVQTIISYLLFKHQGSLVSALDFLATAFFDDEEGLISQGIDQLKQKLHEDGGLIHQLKASLVTDEDSIINQAVRLIRYELTSSPHETLKQSRIALSLLKSAVETQADRQTLNPLLQSSRQWLETLDQNKEEIFKSRQLITDSQFEMIRQFKEVLQHGEQNPQAPLESSLLLQLNSCIQILTSAYRGQSGALQELLSASDQILDRIEKLLEKLEHLPQQMISHAFSPSTQPPQVPEPAASTQPPTAPQAQEPTNSISYSTILSQSSSLLSTILATAGQAVSQRAASSLASMMLFIFDKIKEHLEQNQEHQHIIDTIDPLMQQIVRAQESGSWSDLIATLQNCKNVLQDQQVYLQTFRLPLNSVRPSESAISHFYENIKSHKIALHTNTTAFEATVSPQMIEQEAEKLKIRSAAYGSIRFVAEYILQMQSDDDLYASLISISANTDLEQSQDLIKTRFFEWIDQSNYSFAASLLAKAIYSIISPLFSFFTSSFVSNTVAMFQQWQHAPIDPLHPKDIQVISQLRNWLAILSGSYNEAAYAPTAQARDFYQMLETAIQSPQRNGGLKSSELYTAFSSAAIDKFGPKLEWRKSLGHYFDVQIPSDSSLSFLSPVLSLLNTFCYWTLNILLIIPEWIANTILGLGTHLFLKNSSILENKINSTISAIQSNTQTSYALNKVIYRQLQRVWASMQTTLQSSNEELNLESRNSISKQQEISRLVEYLFEVLNKSRYGTQDRLRSYLESRLSVRSRAEREIDELFLPEALETAVSMISISLDAVMTEDALNELIFDLLCISNSSMDAQENVSPEDFATLEKAIRDQTDQILEASIFYAIGEKFDFTNERQKRGVHQFIEELKGQSVQVCQTLQETLANFPFQAAASAQSLNRLHQAIETSIAFQRNRMEALSRADGNRSFHTETKQKLNEISEQLVNRFTPTANFLNDFAQTYEENLQIERGDQFLQSLDQTLTNLQNTLQPTGTQTSHFNQAETSIQTMQEMLQQLHPLEGLISHQRQFYSHKTTLEQHLRAGKTARGHLDVIMQSASLLERIRFAKMQEIPSLPPSLQIRKNERMLVQLIQQLPHEFSHRSLLDPLLNLMQARTSQEINQANQRYIHNLGSMIRQASHAMQTAKDSLIQTTNVFKQEIAAKREEAHQRLQTNRQTLETKFHQFNQQLNTVREWTDHVHDISIWNFFVFDMQGITDITKDLAFARSKQKVEELRDALFQRHYYIGILHHLVFLPFVEQHAPGYLR